MITFETYMGIVDMSCDIYRGMMERLSLIYKSHDASFLETKMILSELDFLGNINKYMEMKGHPKPGMARVLRAHGATEDGYKYYDGLDDERRYAPIQWWIEGNEGKHDLLFIESCNRSMRTLKPRRDTFLIYPLGTYSRTDLINAIFFSEYQSSIVLVPPENLEDRIRPSHQSP